MPFFRAMQPSFAAGELSPALWARTDLAKYQTGLRLAKNVFIHPHGGASNRPGTLWAGETKYPNKESRLIPFMYSTEQAYVLEFGDKYIRVIVDGGYVLTSANVPYEIVSPYADSDVFGIKYTQSADVLFLCSPNHPPQELRRYAHDNWELVPFEFKGGPFQDENTTSTTITPSGSLSVGGTVTLTASASLFAAGDAGSLVRVSHHVGEQKTTKVFSANGTSDALEVEGEWNFRTSGKWKGTLVLEKSYDDGATWIPYKTYITDTITDGNHDRSYTTSTIIKVRATMTGYATDTDHPGPCTVTLTAAPRLNDGIVKIAGVTNDTVVTGIVKKKIASVSATKLWALGAWSDTQGWPMVPMFFQERLCFGGTAKAPSTLWFSEAGNYNSFKVSTPQVDSDAITAPIVSRMVNEIRGMVPLKDLMVLTSGTEWRISAASSGAFTYKDKEVTPEGYRGTSNIEPLTVGNTILFIQEKGSTVRDLGYSLENDGYTGNDLTVLADHLFKGHEILDWTYQQEPWSLVWCVRDDGKALSLTYMKEHEVWAWTQHETAGEFESVCSIPGAKQDDVYFIVKRTINGVTKRFVEKLAVRLADRDVKKAYFVDCGATYHGVPTSTISGLDWLEGETVSVLADGGVVSDLVVTGGAITLPEPAEYVTVGLPYVSEMETLQVDAELADGTIQGRPKRITDVILRLQDTRGVAVAPTSSRPDYLIEIKPPFTVTDPIALFTGDTQPIVIPSGFDRNGGSIYIKQAFPLPMTVLAVIPSVGVGK